MRHLPVSGHTALRVAAAADDHVPRVASAPDLGVAGQRAVAYALIAQRRDDHALVVEVVEVLPVLRDDHHLAGLEVVVHGLVNVVGPHVEVANPGVEEVELSVVLNGAAREVPVLIAREAMDLLVMQMSERKKRRPRPLAEPVHRVVPPVLVERETTR